MNKQMLAAAVSAATYMAAIDAHATNGDQMIGVTATQWGMAGAVVAAPQDAGTIMSNPAGLAELGMKEVRFDMGFGLLNPPRKANGTESDSDYYLIPSGAVAFNVNDRLYLGMGMAGLSGMGVDFADIMAAAPGAQAVVTTKQFYKIAPGFGYKVNDKLSIGAALNIDYQSLAIHNTAFTLPQNQVYGFGATAGLIYKFNNRLQVGASWISKQSMDEFKWNTTAGRYAMTMDAPQQFAVGVAFKPMPGLLIEADVKHIGFSDVLGRVPFQTPGGPSAMNFGWDDQVVYAIGVQKEINSKTIVRAGFNYGKSPIGREDVNNNIGSLAVTEKHLSVGMTRKLSDKVSASLSYMHAFHNDITSNVAPRNKIELEQNIANVQVSYLF
ncbi:MAG: long-chain fatty acid ABC transporter [Thiobacillus sp. 63-78]|uniref:OmpP1/FadL family transporter n=1 Tax=Thiobacillus sp. 63-78 TaxID=1895859 RepID=UPI0009672001|nr:outer membrane protein transport protein [Thiobacillus sp. 63-78]MBN8764127.1 outer membrane protein transport protein [Thiobacillus sp.]MBN8773229.1 outer membrane protein transport protein [Thiobacillus sp.]OJZ09566.1 MAG: long-chain fatty acid ABC transporter [Thiobacillus sp. 63-78]